ncbi:hypothetical protein ACIQD3_12500 [Peribacillus loiseleuriae]|uniref:hypothetical protein n=1 Tax=Peribacillus loiseleuriae TaxID=1679170 RepID=UPI0037FE5B78
MPANGFPFAGFFYLKPHVPLNIEEFANREIFGMNLVIEDGKEELNLSRINGQ